MRRLKHLPVDAWPAADRQAFDAAYQTGDIFDETAGEGAHLADGTRRMIRTAYRRWLGFLTAEYPEDFSKLPGHRITPERIRSFVDRLTLEVRATTVARNLLDLCYAARLIAPDANWEWLAAIGARVAARGAPQNRFHRLVPGWHTLDLGIELMDQALGQPVSKARDIRYRDGLLIAFISLWPLRRRTIAALTVDHLVFDDAGLVVRLDPENTKSKRPESARVSPELVPYFQTYLDAVRPRLVGTRHHKGLWASRKLCPLTDGRIYDICRTRVLARFGKEMGPHDFRRAAATFIAIDAPDQVGLIPGVLSHTSPDVSEKHYNLANSAAASRRYNATLSGIKESLRSKQQQ
jgi:integrase/recombinase XerD